MENNISSILSEIAQAWKEGGKNTRKAIVAAGVFLISALSFKMSAGVLIYREIAEPLALFSVVVGTLIIGGVLAHRNANEQVERKKKVEAAEERVTQHPDEPQAAWDLARIKLESYLDRNISQVRSIFWITLLVMIAGFVLIGIGIAGAFNNPENLSPALISSCSGILVNFIGATLLVVYKSTMNQAKDYVAILERINAVGMSVQILEKLDGADENLKHKTTAEISKQLLELYKKP